MKVLLLKDVPSLGQAGTVHEVREGYARNFLVPRGLATEATEARLRALDEQQRAHRDRKARQDQAAQALAKRLAEVIVEIKARVGESGKLYGAVTAQDVAEALARRGFPVSKRQVELVEPIKAIGFYRVPVRIHPKVVASVEVNVSSE